MRDPAPVDPRIADMPECIRPVAEHLGYGVARALVDNFPGYELYIPHKMRPGHVLEALGADAERLCTDFGGTKIDVPLKLITADARARRARDMAAQGLTNSQIAGSLGLTRSGVKRLLNSGAPSPRPMGRKGREADPRQINIEDFLKSDASR